MNKTDKRHTDNTHNSITICIITERAKTRRWIVVILWSKLFILAFALFAIKYIDTIILFEISTTLHNIKFFDFSFWYWLNFHFFLIKFKRDYSLSFFVSNKVIKTQKNNFQKIIRSLHAFLVDIFPWRKLRHSSILDLSSTWEFIPFAKFVGHFRVVLVILIFSRPLFSRLHFTGNRRACQSL